MELQNKNHKKLLIIVLVVVFLALIGGGVFYAERFKKPVSTRKVESQAESGTVQQAASVTGTRNILVCGIDNTKTNSDVIVLVCINFDKKTVKVLHLPRDTYVGDDALPTGKLNSIYGKNHGGEEGLRALAQKVTDLTGLQVDDYAAITLSGVVNVANAVGGVPVNIQTTIYDGDGNIVMEPGEQLIEGNKAEWLVRFRKGYANADIGRIGAQQQFLKALVKTVRSQGSLKMLQTVSKVYDQVTTDISLPMTIKLATAAVEIKDEDIQFFIAPGAGVMSHGYAVYGLDAEKFVELLNQEFYPADHQVTLDELKVVEPTRDLNQTLPGRETSGAAAGGESASGEDGWFDPNSGDGAADNGQQQGEGSQADGAGENQAASSQE